MIARLHVLLPFSLTVPDGQEFPVYEYDDEGYAVRVQPPVRSDRGVPPHEDLEQVRLDGAPAYQADALRIDFRKESFKRETEQITRELSLDPPHEVLRRAINSFLLRLRHVTRAGHIRPIEFPTCSWRLQYLNDDGTELEPDAKLFRGVGTLQFSLRWAALNKPIWEDVYRLPIDFEPFPWEELLLDAGNDLPRVGPAVVLAATALEVFIAHVLDLLAARSAVPAPLWDWLNERADNHLRQPSVEEQYDTLLKVFTGHSLKDAASLWEAFMNLKTARNKFVHEGIAKVGGTAVSSEAAGKLVGAALEIVATVREWLPSELQWPVLKKQEIKFEATKKLT
jgi:hypothetical protein